jgi:arylamine N-acetyltransferase
LNNFSGNNLDTIPYTENIDVLLQNPIASLDLNYNNTDKFLSAHAKYFQYLNCYNPEEQVQKSFILQKNID